jgi:hypothetical protein
MYLYIIYTFEILVLSYFSEHSFQGILCAGEDQLNAVHYRNI